VRLLGAILAGGASRRFGSDKALARIEGRAMIEHVAERLAAQCEAVVVVGRDWPGLDRVEDRPAPRLGPLGGLAGALAYAEAHGFEAVLTSGCDLPGLPLDLANRLAPPDALLKRQPTAGLWKASHAAELVDYIRTAEDHSIRGWAARCDARWVEAETLPNINTPEDLARYVAIKRR